MKVLVLNSGGYDSTLMMHLFKSLGYEVWSLSIDYGQPLVELDYAEKTCKKLNIPNARRIKIPVQMPWATHEALYTDVSAGHVGYIPMRNSIFLSFALSICEVNNIDAVGIGLLGCGDFADNSPDFADDFNIISSRIGVDVLAPLGNLEKVGVYSLGNIHGIDVAETWSCNTPTYVNDKGEVTDVYSRHDYTKAIQEGYKPVRCGVCNSCVSVKEAIRNKQLEPKTELKFNL